MIWFDVNEELPREESDVIGRLPSGTVRKLRFVPADEGDDDEDNRPFFVPGEVEIEAFPTHWMTKTMALAALMEDRGWEVRQLGGQVFVPQYSKGLDVAIHPYDTLYNPRHFALAWKLVEWAATSITVQVPVDPVMATSFVDTLPMPTFLMHWWKNEELWSYGQEFAQAAILDKVLELALRARLYDKKDESDGESTETGNGADRQEAV